METLIRYNGKWYNIIPKPGEPARITDEVAWLKIKEGKGYKELFEKERKISKLLYNE